jgi:uncharacterized protein YcfL
MKNIFFLSLFLFTIGCSSHKEMNLQDKDIQYQRFLSEKNLKNLESRHEK